MIIGRFLNALLNYRCKLGFANLKMNLASSDDEDCVNTIAKRRAKTNAERGQAFRARQDEYVIQLTLQNEQLHEEIRTLKLSNQSWKSHILNSRDSLSGSLVQLIYEYHRLFKHGLLDKSMVRTLTSKRQIDRQEEFLRQVIDPCALVGGSIGPEVSIEQWRRYTCVHSSVSCSIEKVEVAGPRDNPIAIVFAPLQACISMRTLQALFPNAVQNDALVSKLVGRVLQYDTVKYYQFTDDGRIVVERVDVSFVSGLIGAGCTIPEIQMLLSHSPITVDSMIDTDVSQTQDLQ